MTVSFRAHPLVRLFVAPRPKIDPLEAATLGASDAELAHLAEGDLHRIDHLRHDAMMLLYGGTPETRLPL
ncbi:MAG: hypothetical protein QOG89_2092 [Thermomicrobiales bacterium]|jgi:hypothetical protein|nr:hypothetical protein [Thermomicrobiales bacterium]MEA2525944.1 hypothetical protein [Thermomicrobiales bacterium]MEA2530448.1 hypothetical protein [Thermomicrobiales bacterium]